uniref:hypothetical protein n=1 Tax=Microseira wollei TaxID=467598 RepID=UPI001CFEFC56
MKILNACKVGIALTAAAFLGLATAQRADAISFSLTDLGTLGGNYSYPGSINEYGQVVGHSTTADGSERAFFWDNSSGMTNLGIIPPSGYNYCYDYYEYGYRYVPCPSSTSSYAVAINDLGQVIGTSTTIYSGNYYRPPYNYTEHYEQNVFLWDKNSGMINLGTLGGKNQATAINNYGQVIGYSVIADGQTRAFFWEKSSGMINLGTLGGDYSSANAINDYGQVIGSSVIADGQTRAFLWEKSSGMSDLGTLGGNSSY